MFRSDFRKKGVCSKSATKTLYPNKVLVSEWVFKLVCHCHLVIDYQRLIVCKKYCWKIFEQTVTVAYLKRQPPELFCIKGVLKGFTEKCLCWNLFLIKLQVAGLRACNAGVSQRRCFPLKSAKFLRALIFKNTCIFM